jgi:hypothetical protein
MDESFLCNPATNAIHSLQIVVFIVQRERCIHHYYVLGYCFSYLIRLARTVDATFVLRNGKSS